MTSTQLQHLATLIEDTDFIINLRASRPAIDPENWQQAAGWEACVEHIIQMPARPQEEGVRHDQYVEVEKL